jgi:3',5'-cyclic AMP phosphodiesterase CpdA
VKVLAHLSDLHFGRSDARRVSSLVSVLGELRPDLIVISGDLTQRARPAQFREARAFLDALAAPVLAVPGNHDVPLWNLYQRFFSPLGRYRRYIDRDTEPAYRDGEIVVLGVNTARGATLKSGRLAARQIARARAGLRALDARAVKVVVAHHPLARLARCGADIVLAGHLHASAAAVSVNGEAIVAQAGTATSTRVRGEPNAFNVLRVAAREVEVERWSWQGAAFAPLATQGFVRTPGGWRAR